MIREKAWWPWAKRIVGLLFMLLVITLLVRYAQRVDWDDVMESLRALPRSTLLLAAALAATSHLLYSTFDLIGRRYTGHQLPVPQVMQVNFISYAFNLNMGSAVGGVGFRYRLYSRLGLAYGDITKVLTISMLTNWIGFFLQAGLVFTLAPLELPPQWKIDSEGLRLLGLAFLTVAFVYIGLCGWSPKRSFTVRGHELLLPRPKMAAAQLAVSCTNWMVIGATIWVLLQGKVAYAEVLSVFLVGALAGIVVRVPAGLGVLEAVFIGLLSHRIPEGQLLAGLLAYRAVYYIAPLLAAAVLYLTVELRARKRLAAA